MLCILGANGCGQDVCFLDASESSYQLAPNARAVAFINPLVYSDLVGGPADSRRGFDCVIKEFCNNFINSPDSVIIVFDFEDRAVTRGRLWLNHGIDAWSGFDDVPDEDWDNFVDRYVEADAEVRDALSEIPRPNIVSFNSTFRQLESGTGFRLLNPFRPGPPSLRGYVFLPTREDLMAGRFLHEFCHYWGARLGGPSILAKQIGAFGDHWGYTSVGGLLGGWIPGSLVSTGEGVYQATVRPSGRALNNKPYAPLELYLMGLVGPDEVPPIQVAANVKVIGQTEDFEAIFSASAMKMVTIEQIIKANGPRVPRVKDSPKHFKLALVILTDHYLTRDEWSFYQRGMDFMAASEERSLNEAFPQELFPAHHSYWTFLSDLAKKNTTNLSFINFFMATGGKGMIEFEELIPQSSKKWASE